MTLSPFGHSLNAKLSPAVRATTPGSPTWLSILGDVMNGLTGSAALEMTADCSSGISVLRCSIGQRRYVVHPSKYILLLFRGSIPCSHPVVCLWSY